MTWWVPELQLSTATMHDNSTLVRVANVWKREKSKFMDALNFYDSTFCIICGKTGPAA